MISTGQPPAISTTNVSNSGIPAKHAVQTFHVRQPGNCLTGVTEDVY
jgi:hypothetical protein